MCPPILRVVLSLIFYYNYDLLIGLLLKQVVFPLKLKFNLLDESTVNKKDPKYL